MFILLNISSMKSRSSSRVDITSSRLKSGSPKIQFLPSSYDGISVGSASLYDRNPLGLRGCEL